MSIRVLTHYCMWKAKLHGALSRASCGLGAVLEPGMSVRSVRGNREISCLAGGGSKARRPVSGRRGAEADDARTGEVGLAHSSDEADEQIWETRSGAGGAKGRGQGKHGLVT